MKPQNPIAGAKPTELHRQLQQWFNVLRGNVSYGNMTPSDPGRNIDGYPTTIVTPHPLGTEFAIPHGLGRVPVGYHVTKQSGPYSLYNGISDWTDSNIYLIGTSEGTTFTLFIF